MMQATSLLDILRKADNLSNTYLERFMTKYNYMSLSKGVREDHLEEFLIDNGIAIKVAGIEPLSVVDGEGLRYTIFTQGCEHNCPGCQNPETHGFSKSGQFIGVVDLYEELMKYKYIKGVTFSGGDPLFQKNYKGVLNLCKLIKTSPDSYNYDIWLYTGYEWDYVRRLEIARYLDIVVDGRFIERFKSLQLKFRGSSNQRIIDVRQSLENNEVIEWHHI